MDDREHRYPTGFADLDDLDLSYDSFGIRDPDAQNAFLHMLLSMDPPEHNVHRRI